MDRTRGLGRIGILAAALAGVLVSGACAGDLDLISDPARGMETHAALAMMPLGTIADCPEELKVQCCPDGGMADCACSELDENGLSEHLDQSEHWSGGALEYCSSGVAGIGMAVADGAAFVVSDWGACWDLAQAHGAHIPGPYGVPGGGPAGRGVVLINEGLSEEDEAKTQWHEGESYKRCGAIEDQAELAACHEQIHTEGGEDACYGDSSSFPVPL
jgi:hypothetical protein